MDNHDDNTIQRPTFRLAALFAMLAVAAAACGSFDLDVSIAEDGSGVRSEETLNLDLLGVDTVEVSGNWDVDVNISSDPASVDIAIDDNFTKYTDIKVTGSVLQIEFNRGNLDPNITPTASVQLASVKRVEVNGASSLAVRGDVTMLSAITADGASELSISGLNVTSLDIELNGSSDATISGSADSGRIEIAGASSANLSALTWKTVEVDVAGASELLLTVTGRLTGKAEGASDVLVAGGAVVEASSSGASTIAAE